MKLLYITNGFPPHRWAGTETYTAAIAEAFVRRGHEVDVLCAGEWEGGAEYWNGVTRDMYNGIAVQRINLNWTKSPNPFRYLYDNPVIAQYLAGFLKELNPDLVHVTSCETMSTSVIRVVKEAGFPLVLSLTDFWFLCPRINLLHADGHNCSGQTTSSECLECMMSLIPIYRKSKERLGMRALTPALELLSRYPAVTRRRGLRGRMGNMAERKSILQHALTLPDVRITASSFVRDLFVSNGVRSSILVKSYGHDLSWLANYPGKSQEKVVRFGYIGQILDSKGVHLLLQALSQLPQSLADKWSLTIYGNIDQYPDYSRRIRELAAGQPNITFGGTYPHSESGKIYSELDILVVPSIWYDFPLVIYEAFATGTPVITTNLGGMAEAVQHEKNGLLFERGNIESLAEQMQRLIEQPQMIGMLRRGIPRVKAVDEEVDDLTQLYRGLVKIH